MECQKEVCGESNFPSSSRNTCISEYKNESCSAQTSVQSTHHQSLPHASGDAFHQAAGMSNPGPVLRNDEKMAGEAPLLSREELSEQAQELIDKINEKRKRDTNILEDFRKALQEKVAVTCSAVEERMYRVYEKSGKDMQPKLQEFFATLDRVAAIEEELNHFKEALGVLYTDIQSKP
nr:synaptonemal complex central element protein 2-like [Lytechinus pictus]